MGALHRAHQQELEKARGEARTPSTGAGEARGCARVGASRRKATSRRPAGKPTRLPAPARTPRKRSLARARPRARDDELEKQALELDALGEHAEKVKALENDRDSRHRGASRRGVARARRREREAGEGRHGPVGRTRRAFVAARGEGDGRRRAGAEMADVQRSSVGDDGRTRRLRDEAHAASDRLGDARGRAARARGRSSARRSRSSRRESSRAEKAHAKWDADRQSLERAKDALAVALAQIEEAEGRPLCPESQLSPQRSRAGDELPGLRRAHWAFTRSTSRRTCSRVLDDDLPIDEDVADVARAAGVDQAREDVSAGLDVRTIEAHDDEVGELADLDVTRRARRGRARARRRWSRGAARGAPAGWSRPCGPWRGARHGEARSTRRGCCCRGRRRRRARAARPCASSSATRAMPEPSFRFALGQWTIAVPSPARLPRLVDVELHAVREDRSRPGTPHRRSTATSSSPSASAHGLALAGCSAACVCTISPRAAARSTRPRTSSSLHDRMNRGAHA